MRKTIDKHASIPNNGDPMNMREAVSFIADLSGELASIAGRHHLDTLAYLLDMARLEADTLRREMKGP
jgi:hypothetical protein